MAESFFFRLHRAEIGAHHSVAGPYLGSYASIAMTWREDNRRVSNGDQFLMAKGASALAHTVSRAGRLLAAMAARTGSEHRPYPVREG